MEFKRTVAIVAATISSSFPAVAENFHLYIYNECQQDAKTTVESYGFGQDKPNITVVDVKSGSQTMAAVSDTPKFKVSSASNDGSQKWQTIEFNTTKREYTHVLSCGCVGNGCPNNWPNPPSRQYSK
jgi:hypothetical protein